MEFCVVAVEISGGGAGATSCGVLVQLERDLRTYPITQACSWWVSACHRFCLWFSSHRRGVKSVALVTSGFHNQQSTSLWKIVDCSPPFVWERVVALNEGIQVLFTNDWNNLVYWCCDAAIVVKTKLKVKLSMHQLIYYIFKAAGARTSRKSMDENHCFLTLKVIWSGCLLDTSYGGILGTSTWKDTPGQTHCKGYISHLAQEHLQISQDPDVLPQQHRPEVWRKLVYRIYICNIHKSLMQFTVVFNGQIYKNNCRKLLHISNIKRQLKWCMLENTIHLLVALSAILAVGNVEAMGGFLSD